MLVHSGANYRDSGLVFFKATDQEQGNEELRPCMFAS